MNGLYWKGKLRPIQSRVFSPLNTALLFGESLFETLPVYGGKPLFWKEHLARLERGARFLRWKLPPKMEFKKVIGLFNRQWADPGYLVRFSLFQELKGTSGFPEGAGKKPAFWATLRPLRHGLNWENPLSGEVGVSPWRAPGKESFPNEFKTLSYMTTRAVFREHPHWKEMLRVNDKGQVVDGGFSTPLWFDGKRLWASPLGLGGLRSVSRDKILKLAGRIGIKVVQKPWTPREAEKGELIFTGSGVGILRASRMGGKSLGDLGLSQQLWNHYKSWAWSNPVGF